MRNDRYEKFLREQAEEEMRYREELKKNPLLQYSTSELKAELRRRKRENEKTRKRVILCESDST